MYPQGRYNLNFNISAFLIAIVIIGFCLLKKDMKKKTTRIFMLIVSFLGIASLCEVFTLIMRNDPSKFNYDVCTITSFISHLLHNSVPFLFLLYVRIHFRPNKTGFFNKSFYLMTIPEAVLCLLILIPPLRHLCWDIGMDGSYTHGVLYNYFFVVVSFYIICIISYLIRVRKVFKHEIMYMSLLIGGFVISLIVQAASSHLKITYLIQTLCMLGEFFIIESDGENIDKSTGARNRYAFQNDVNIIFGTYSRAEIIAVKTHTQHYSSSVFGMDNFSAMQKSIYKWLDENFSDRTDIYYIGRGNFVLIAYKDDGFNTDEIMESIISRFEDKWHGSTVDLVIPVQILVTDIPDKAVSMDQVNDIVFTDFETKLGSGRISSINGLNEQVRRNAVERAIQRAIDNRSFEVYYQPIFDTAEHRVHSAEALLRLNDSELGFISPEEFIHIAEQNGTINFIGTFVFENVCRFIHEHDLKKLGIDFVEVNLSTVQCMDETIPDRFDAILEKYGIPHEMVNLEITESALYYNETEMLSIVTELHKRGYHFSLDDFGTGYSNYSYIIKFPFSLIKVDKSFLWAADESEQSDRLLTHMIQMVKDLDLKTVVEGVETEVQKAKLEAQNVEYLQGFLFSRPVCEKEFLDYIKKCNS